MARGFLGGELEVSGFRLLSACDLCCWGSKATNVLNDRLASGQLVFDDEEKRALVFRLCRS